MDGFLNKERLTISVSTWSVIKVLLVLLAAWFLYLVRDVIAIVFVSLIFAAALDPWVDWFERYKLPRGISVIIMYVILFGFISLIIFLLVPALLTQLQELSQSFPIIFEKAVNFFSGTQTPALQNDLAQKIQENIGSIQSALIKATSGVFSTIVSIFGGIVSFFAVLVITFYITVEEEAIKRVVLFSVPQKYQRYTMQLINAMQLKIGLWLRGELILMLIIGVLTYVGLTIIGIKFALVLALLAGLAEFIPFLGPLIAAIPAVFIAFVQSPLSALGVIILYIIIQQLENNIVVPKVMQKAVGLNPLVVIIVLLIGARLAGVAGAILAVPVTTAVSVIVRDKLGLKKLGSE